MENLIGQVFAGQYQIQKRLGRGGMGTVYLATQIKLKRDVAVKMLNTNLSDNDIHRARFEREAKTAASLNHLHIVSIFDYGIEDDIHYVAMPYISGGTLAQRYATINQSINNIPALHETANVISQIASALDYAHSRGIIHRDVKPSNIMFDEQGNAFLTDFGIARLLATTTSFTMSGTQIGTPQYMPPEQWDSKADLSQATDQYALAVMTYQLVTGNLPLDGETSMELMHSHIYESPHPVQAYRPDLPLEIDDVLQKALSKDSNDRYTSTGDFARAFDDAVNLVDIETSTAFFTTLLETPSSTSNRPASRSHRSSQSGSPVQPSQTNAQPKRLLNVVMGIIGIIALIGIGFGLSSAFLGGDSPIELTATAIAALPTETDTPTLTSSPPPTDTPTLTSSPPPTDTPTLTSPPPPTDTPTLTSSPSPTATAQQALELAQVGVTRNADWTLEVREFDGVEMVLVPSGCFMMGSYDGDDDEQPVHEQCFDEPFWIDRYEVTQGDFARLGGVQAQGSQFDDQNRPVEQITWFEARDFCALRGGRLPTEREWEYAARGPDGLTYPWGDTWDENRAISRVNSGYQTAPVGSLSGGVSWVGAYDMSGNVYEWVSSVYMDYPYTANNEDLSGSSRGYVLRGASWLKYNSIYFSGSYRVAENSSFKFYNVGFRCARS